MVNGRGSARVTPDIAEIALGRVGTFEALSVDSEGVGVEGNVFERDCMGNTFSYFRGQTALQMC